MKPAALVLIGAMMVSFSSWANDPADVNLTKASMNANWNVMIDGNNHDRNDIQKRIDQSLNDAYAEDSERSRVLDFVDVEVGWGETQSNIVDRRFDSVGDAYVIDINALVPRYVPGI